MPDRNKYSSNRLPSWHLITASFQKRNWGVQLRQKLSPGFILQTQGNPRKALEAQSVLKAQDTPGVLGDHPHLLL
jgi:hypothetical protein